MPVSLSLVGLWWATCGCTADGPPPPTDTPDSATPSVTEPSAPLTLVWGDPILEHGGDVIEGSDDLWEFVDTVALDDEHALSSGQGGLALVDLTDGSHLWTEPFMRTYDLAWDAGLEVAYAGSREQQVYRVDLSDRMDPVQAGELLAWEGVHEDLAAGGGLLLVAAPETGAVLLDGESGQVHSILPADWASAVALHQDRAVVADRNELVLFDVGDPETPVELDRASLSVSARDLAFDGTTLGVALGGHGVAVVRVRDDALMVDTTVEVPGSSYGVALDGERLWASAWSDVALIWLGDGGPVVIGTEPVRYNTLGVGAAGGRAVASDWFGTLALEHVEGVAGPELVVPPEVFSLGADGDVPEATVALSNLGALTLEASASLEDPSAALSETEWVVAPGETVHFTVTGEAGRPLTTRVRLTSNDPDEADSTVEIRTGDRSVGQVHDDFTVEGYLFPDANLLPYSLSSQAGRVTFLAYFALY